MESSTAAQHSLNIEQCKKITATAIDSVDAFSDRQIILSFSGGRIVISGSGMKISGFLKSSGTFTATGVEISQVKYLPRGGSLKQKLFR